MTSLPKHDYFWAGLAFLFFAAVSLVWHLYCGIVAGVLAWYAGCREIWKGGYHG